MPGSGIFISYRRDDSAGFAGRLYDRLAERFGADRVFMDIDAIAPGHEFATDIEKALTDCTACVVLIGRNWLTITDDDGRRRLDDPTDFVRLEVATAIRRGITVFPVLVDKAKPPSSAALPDELRPLAGRQAIELTNERWNYDVGRLLLALEEEVGPTEPPVAQTQPTEGSRSGGARRKLTIALIAAGVASALAIAGVTAGLATRSDGPSTSGSASSSGSGQSPLPPLEGTYATTVKLQTSPALLGDNLLWTNPDPHQGDTWDGGIWIFTPPESWTVFDRKNFSGTWSDDGSYISKASGVTCDTGSADVTRTFTISRADSSTPLTSFGGVLRIHWTCEGTDPFIAVLHVEGTAR